MTKLLGTLMLILSTLQASTDHFLTFLPPKYHNVFHITLGLLVIVVWAFQTNYGPGGQVEPKPDLAAGGFTQAVAKFRGEKV